MSVVYIIRAIGTDTVKIGRTVDIQIRLGMLQCGSPARLKVLRTVPGDRAAERWFHARYSGLRIVNEWFHFDPSMLTVAVPLEVSIQKKTRAKRRAGSHESRLRMTRWVTAAVRSHWHLGRNEAIKAAAIILGVSIRRVGSFYRGEDVSVWADEYNAAREWYSEWLPLERERLRQAELELAQEQTEVEAFLRERKEIAALETCVREQEQALADDLARLTALEETDRPVARGRR